MGVALQGQGLLVRPQSSLTKAVHALATPGGLPGGIQERDLEDAFIKFGTLRSVWVARRPPGFGEPCRVLLSNSPWSLPSARLLLGRCCR